MIKLYSKINCGLAPDASNKDEDISAKDHEWTRRASKVDLSITSHLDRCNYE